jgi:hypothetical protein
VWLGLPGPHTCAGTIRRGDVHASRRISPSPLKAPTASSAVRAREGLGSWISPFTVRGPLTTRAARVTGARRGALLLDEGSALRRGAACVSRYWVGRSSTLSSSRAMTGLLSRVRNSPSRSGAYWNPRLTPAAPLDKTQQLHPSRSPLALCPAKQASAASGHGPMRSDRRRLEPLAAPLCRPNHRLLGGRHRHPI